MSVSARFWMRFLNQTICLLLSFSLSLPSLASKTPTPKHSPQFQGQSYEGVNHFPKPEVEDEKAWSEYLENELKNAEKTNLEKVAGTGVDLVQLMIRYKQFYAKSRVEIDNKIAEVGTERFVTDFLDRDKVYFEDADLGKMEFTNIDGEPVAKIVHKESGVSFIIYDEDRLDRNSKHFKTYIARQHYDSGSSREHNKYIDENGKKRKVKLGRDVLLMSIDNEDISKVEVNGRKRGFKNWWQATYKKPTWGKRLPDNDIVHGVFSGLAQFFAVGALATLVDFMLPLYDAGNKPLAMATFTLAFGSVFGIWNSFYQNWRSRGGKLKRDIKNMSVSFSYYFGIALIGAAGSQTITLHDLSIDPSTVVAYIQSLFSSIPSPGEALNTIKNAHPLAALAASHFFINFAINNEFKNVGYWMQRIEEIERKDLGELTVKLPKIVKDDETGNRKLKMVKVPYMTKRFMNRQYKYYLPVNMAKFLDQAWFGATIFPAMSGDVPVWFPLLSVFGFFSLTYGSVRALNTWGYKKHEYAVTKLKVREESAYYFGSFYWNKLKQGAEKIRSIVTFKSKKEQAEDCQKLLQKDAS